ncbi:UDP-N-acetylglucosamine transferase subunit ALG14 homolog isoform X3 [Hypomesus transpacificus]|uniref:UDP-N-acetylglucosamine transferase subunit ALG14 homolog isoform X3 n=1 Tax=Hypomesus transpacificus TaxID=137520 RepID=UPI001F076117|nr:UDP-N-acetylglucosamine transferase subunit ALG14 homolog isoform X3 [Hypomesus transpacificus]
MVPILSVLFGICCVGIVIILRLLIVIRSGSRCKPGQKGPVCVLVVAGSDTDKMSEDKIRAYESLENGQESKTCTHMYKTITQVTHRETQFTVHRIPRSREVRQSWSSSVASTLNAIRFSIPLMFQLRPDMVLCNGPGTCVPLCLAGLLLGTVGLKKVVIVYVESICRVETLSLSGKILYHLSDYFFVQWSTLKDKYPKAIYLGRIV